MRRIDNAAHKVMKFYPDGLCGATTIDHYTAFYHEAALYSVRNSLTNALTLVYAANPKEAIDKIKGDVIITRS